MRRYIRILGFISIISIFAFLCFFPLYIMFKISVSAPEDIFTPEPSYSVRHFTLGHFKEMFAAGGDFFSPLKKSFTTGILASLLSLLIAVPAAYAISKFNLRLRYGLVVLIFVTRMVPEVSIALPVSISFIKMGLFDTTLGLTLAHLIRILPIACFILVGVFSAVPPELEKQALIDGLTPARAFFKVVLPLCLGGIGVAGLFSFLFSWDEFIYASYLCLAEPTMPLKMYYFISRGDIFSSATYAVVITVPVLILTFAMQKYLKPDYLAGAIKG